MKKEYNQSFKGVNNQSHSTTYNQGYSLKPMDLSERINARMQALGLTQETLAKRAGVSQTTIHKLLSGKSRRTRYLNPLAKALACSPEWLEGGDGPQPEPVLPNDTVAILLGAASPQGRTTIPDEESANPPSLASLLDALAERVNRADPAVRDEVTRLVLRYIESPDAGLRVVRAIEQLLGTDDNNAAPRP